MPVHKAQLLSTTAATSITRIQVQTTKTWPPGTSQPEHQSNDQSNNNNNINTILNCNHHHQQSSVQSRRPGRGGCWPISIAYLNRTSNISTLLVNSHSYKGVERSAPRQQFVDLPHRDQVKSLPSSPRLPKQQQQQETSASETVKQQLSTSFNSSSLNQQHSGSWPNQINNNESLVDKQQQTSKDRTLTSSNLKSIAMATVRPISPQYQHTLDSAISLAKELASKNMADSGDSSPKTPNSPDKKRFNFKLKHFSKSFSDASANIRDIESSITYEAKQAYKSLVERGPFNSYSSHSHTMGGLHSPHAHGHYTNDDFSPTSLSPTSTTKKHNNRGCSTFSVKKSFF